MAATVVIRDQGHQIRALQAGINRGGSDLDPSTRLASQKERGSVRGDVISGDTKGNTTIRALGGRDGAQGKSEGQGQGQSFGRRRKKSSKTCSQDAPLEETGSHGGRSRWRRPVSLEEGRGSVLERGGTPGSGDRAVSVPFVGKLLQERRQVGWLPGENRGNPGGYAHLLGLNRDIVRGVASSSRTVSKSSPSSSLLCPRLRAPREWRLVRTRQQGKTPVSRCGSGGLDKQLGASGKTERCGRGRRVIRPSEESPGQGEGRWRLQNPKK